MVRLLTLLVFTQIAWGQLPVQPAWVSIQTTAEGDLHASLTVPAGDVPSALPAAFARAVGCAPRDLEKSDWDVRIQVRCRGARPSPLTFHAALRPFEIAPLLLQMGIDRVDLVVITPRFRSLRLDPAIDPRDERHGCYHASYSPVQLPRQITIDGAFDIGQARMLAAAALGLILCPFLLMLLRPSDLLRLHASMEGIFVLAWIGWIWVLLRFDAGALLSYVLGHWGPAPLLALLAPQLAAVWIGSRVGAVTYARLAPNGLGAAYYRKMKFWSGAAMACFASTFLSVLLPGNAQWTLAAGIILTIACVLWIRSIGRAGSRPASDGDLRQRTFAAAARAGVRLRGVSILTSPVPRPPVALATRWGLVLLNEGLLKTLSRREVDAVVCHELSHIRPVKRARMTAVYVLLVATILGAQWLPDLTALIPVSLLAMYFLLKSWRRGREWAADLDSVRWSGDPEALITGLARVSRAHGLPLEWHAPIRWMMAHPPTMDRIKAIARAGRVPDSRIAELLDQSQRDAADHYIADHYIDASTDPVPEDAAFSPELRKRIQSSLSLYLLAAPLLWGVPMVWLLERTGLDWWAVVIVAIVSSALAMYLGSEWITGSLRNAVKRRAIARHGPGVFTGLSLGAEPRLFDGAYHHDLGVVRFENGALEFAGDRAHFTLDRRRVERVWFGDGPPYWTPRKVVYIECRLSPETEPVIFSLQSLEAWFWPFTVAVAKRLYRQVEAWREGSTSSPAPPLPCALPRVEGSPNPFISFPTAFRSVGIYSGIAFVLGSLAPTFNGGTVFSYFSSVLCPMVVCGALALFMVWPRLKLSRTQ